ARSKSPSLLDIVGVACLFPPPVVLSFVFFPSVVGSFLPASFAAVVLFPQPSAFLHHFLCLSPPTPSTQLSAQPSTANNTGYPGPITLVFCNERRKWPVQLT